MDRDLEKSSEFYFFKRCSFEIPKILTIAFSKGQLISKADWRAIDSPKKRTYKFVLFAFLLIMANKSNSSVRFLGESTSRQSTFRFYLTFSSYILKRPQKFDEIFNLSVALVCFFLKVHYILRRTLKKYEISKFEIMYVFSSVKKGLNNSSYF